MLPRWCQTLVIGNGFDLQCGLKSRFLDFYKNRQRKLYEISADSGSNLKFGNRLRERSLTVWDIILDYETGDLWCDIEAAIAKWAAGPGHYRKVSQHISNTQPNVSVSGFADLHGYITMPNKDNLYEVVARYLLDAYPDLYRDCNESKLGAVLLTELHDLESSFSDFLFSQVSGNDEYQSEAQKLFSDMACKGVPDPGLSFIDTSVLSFNYTEPQFRWDEPHAFVHTVNIHGKLNEGIVFGIDGRNRMGNEIALPFTKTYRLMSRKKRVRYDASYVEHDVLVCGKVDAIKFYGHSLSEADYSYFQAMFDAADLYGGSTVLVFYHRPCSRDEVEPVRAEVMESAIALLSTYGATLDNKDHGNNLIHKLLLEDRLFVEPVR